MRSRISATATSVSGCESALAAGAAARCESPADGLAIADGHSDLLDADGRHAPAAVATGVLTTAVPFLLFKLAIRKVEIASAALLLNLTPAIRGGIA